MKLNAARKAKIETWLTDLKHSANARRAGRCMVCTERPILGRMRTEEDDRAVHWCRGCKREAFGAGRSFANVATSVLMNLPIVIEIGPAQAALF